MNSKGGLYIVEIHHGGKFVVVDHYSGGNILIFNDFDTSMFTYDYVVLEMEFAGYGKVMKCAFREHGEIEKYCYVDDEISFLENICRCTDESNKLVVICVECASASIGVGDDGHDILSFGLDVNIEDEDQPIEIQNDPSKKLDVVREKRKLMESDAFPTTQTDATIITQLECEFEDDYHSTYAESDASIYSDDDTEGKLEAKVYASNCYHHNLKFELGMTFKDCAECKAAIRKWAIFNGHNIKWKKSGCGKLQAKCEGDCPWMLYASRLTREPTCVIMTLVDKHTCVRAIRNRQATSSWIAEMFSEKLQRTPDYEAKEIKKDAQLLYGIDVSISQCYRAKEKAKVKREGSLAEHYSKLRSYVTELKEKDREGRFDLKIYLDSEGNPIFQRLYIGFSCLRKGFMIGCRKVIGFDACFLKTNLGGALLAVLAKDCNFKMYPIAWAVVEKENEETWTWFFEKFFEDLHIEDGYGWSFMSDKQKGLINGIQKLAPNVEHRHCARHVYSNWKKKYLGPKFYGLFWNVVNGCSVNQYHYNLIQLKAESVEAYDDFCKRHPQAFCKSLISSHTKSDMVDDNICEAFNSYILRFRDMPLITMLNEIKLHLMTRMHTIAKSLERSSDLLCPNVRKKLDFLQKSVRLCDLRPTVGGKFEVIYFHDSYIVDLKDKSCTCRAWELTGLPCVHALAGILYAREKIENFVDQFYYKSNCVATYYKYALEPLDDKLSWPPVNQPSVLPPKFSKGPGRQKKERKRDQSELKKQSRNKLAKNLVKKSCKKCGELGHNKRTCKADNARVQPSGQTAQDKRERRKTHEGFGVRIFLESGNVYAKAPGGMRVQFISGPRARCRQSRIPSD